MKVRTCKSRSFTRDLAIVATFFAAIIPATILTGIHPLAIVAFFATTTFVAWGLFTELSKLRNRSWQFSIRFTLLVMTLSSIALGVLKLVRNELSQH
jgi:hypothetical protein